MTFEFKAKSAASTAAAPSGREFLAQAKEEDVALFHDFAGRNDEYSSLDEFLAALQAADWKLCEMLADPASAFRSSSDVTEYSEYTEMASSSRATA